MKKIDIHCHTTPRKLSHVDAESAAPEAILELMVKHDIEKTVLLATYFPKKGGFGSGVSNFRLMRWIEQLPEFLMFGSLDFEHYFYQGYNELEELAWEGKMRGIKIYSGYQSIDPSSKKFKMITKLALEYKLALMIHGGFTYSQGGTNVIGHTHDPLGIEKIANENPDVNIIISHMANPCYNQLIEMVRRTPNIYTDISGLIDSKFDQDKIPDCIYQISRFIGECGPGRLLFGTDFPIQTHGDSVMFIEVAMRDYSDADKQKVYYDNAARLLRLE